MMSFRGPRASGVRTQQTTRQPFQQTKAATKRAPNNFSVRGTTVSHITKALSERKGLIRRYANDSDLPISPHVTIYKQSLPAWTSIAHRVAGLALFGVFGYIGLKAYWINPGVYSYFSAVEDFKVQHPWLLWDTKAVLAASFSYHFFAGLRHFYIESPAGASVLDKQSKVDAFSIGVIVASAATTGIILML